jgi:LAO/AO transport system kinase
MTGGVERILAGDLRAVARTATRVENRDPEALELLRTLFPRTGRARVIGITGAPGAGKSTLTSRLIGAFRARKQRVAVLAVDPSSPFSGGAILGDRIRMQEHHADPGVFIRSLATRGALGGLAAAALDLTLLLDAAGFEVILIETVGIGQDEVDVARLAPVVIVVVVPNMGDGVQAIKAGMLEIASVLVINKADLPGADKLEQELDGFRVPLLRTVATTGEGIDALVEAMPTAATGASPALWEARLRSMYREHLERALPESEVRAAAVEAAHGMRDPWSIVENWVRHPVFRRKPD